ncbi:MAG TPA: sigma-70 family RNA polymerase sigma factor [Phycisphaerae bacterium]|nr:sigma-70 family RNA polymerase sigma factor [Phycisphaerae bacterium]
MDDADDQSVIAAAGGDKDALATLLRMHGPEVRRRLDINPVWRTLLAPADVMQVTYLEAFLRISQLRDRTSKGFIAWLARLARNNLRDGIKELERQKRPNPRQRVRARAADASRSTLLSQLRDSTATTPSRDAAHRESQQALEVAMARLPPLYAQVVREHDIDGQPIAEIAAAMGKSCGAVHMLRIRALDCLQELLGSESRFFSSGS